MRERQRGCGMEIWISLSLSLSRLTHNTTHPCRLSVPGFRRVSSSFWIGLGRFDSILELIRKSFKQIGRAHV